jgi:hypothetical protein
MIHLAARIPVNLSPGQTVLLLVLAAGVILALLAGTVLESVFSALAGMILKMTGHPPPKRSGFRAALDELEERLERERRSRHD